MQVITNSIKIYCMDTVQRARYIDFLCKNGCKIVGAGIGERSMYILVGSATYLPLLEKWNKKISIDTIKKGCDVDDKTV